MTPVGLLFVFLYLNAKFVYFTFPLNKVNKPHDHLLILYDVRLATIRASPWFLLLCRINFPSGFPNLSGQNESFSVTDLFVRNTSWFSIACNHTETSVAEQI